MKNILNNVGKFFQVTPVYQGIASVGGLTGGFFISEAIQNYSQGDNIMGSINMAVGVVNCVSLVLNEMLAIQRKLEYHRIKNSLETYGWDTRILEPRTHFWCQRNMLQIASNDTGCGEQTKNYLLAKGYQKYDFFKE